MELIIIWLICGFICSVIAGAKGRSAWSFFFVGFLLGPLGIILCLVTSKNERKIEKDLIVSGDMRKCPFCAELIKSEAIKCKHCQSDVAPEENIEVEVVSSLVDANDLTKRILECSCGRTFRYAMTRSGEKTRCLNCRGILTLP